MCSKKGCAAVEKKNQTVNLKQNLGSIVISYPCDFFGVIVRQELPDKQKSKALLLFLALTFLLRMMVSCMFICIVPFIYKVTEQYLLLP